MAWRAITRNKLTSFINIAGLSLAMTCCVLVFLYIHDELGYDLYPKHADRIYRVTRDFRSQNGSVYLHLGHVAPPFGPLLKNDFPQDFEEVARTLQDDELFTKTETNGQQSAGFDEPNIFFAEPAILDIFSVQVLKGNPSVVLTRPFTIMLSDRMAMKYFGTLEVVGKHLRSNNQYDLEISGVFKAFPRQSHWHPDFFISFSTLEDDNIYGREGLQQNWGNNSFSTYVLARKNLNVVDIEKQFPSFIDAHMPNSNQQGQKQSTFTDIFLQPLTSIHLYSHLDSEIEANGNITNVYTMGVIGFFIMLIACFNFINLSTARATRRAKEVGLRKVVGAFRRQLVVQYLGESLLTVLIALVLSILCVSLSLPWLNEFTGKELQLADLFQPVPAAFLFGLTLLTGLIAGLYPAFVLSAFKPALILKMSEGMGRRKGRLRKALVVMQFAISIILVIATGIIVEQLHFVEHQELGFNKDQVINLPYLGDEVGNNYDALYNELTKNASIIDVSRSSRIPTGRLLDSQGSSVQKGDTLAPTAVTIKFVRVDPEFFKTYDIGMASGRGFSKNIKSDDSLAFVINQSAARMIGWTDDEAIGKVFQYGGTKGQIIGVVKDFHFESLHEPIVPLVFDREPYYNNLSIKIAGQSMQQGLADVEKVWKEYFPMYPFSYSFLSERYRQLYEHEQKESELFTVFTILALFIASLGLFGLATFNTMQRVKEIGIRKVMGASVTHIVSLLSSETVILVGLANLIAWPVAWYAMSRWLESFAYRININPVVFVVSGLAAILMALLTVGTQTVRAAQANPARSLRQE